jgi:copper/silver efflux system protein
MMWGHGTGSEIMARIAAPMVGGMVTAPLLSMLVVPAAWYLLHQRKARALTRTTAAVEALEGVP